MSAMTRTERARENAIQNARYYVESAFKDLDNATQRIEWSPFRDWLDTISDKEANISLTREGGARVWTIFLLDPQSDLPRRIVGAGIGVHHLKKSTGYDGKIQFSGDSPDGRLDICGYVGSCHLEQYEETVTRTRVVCGDAEEGPADA
jgi:hypothetical protein